MARPDHVLPGGVAGGVVEAQEDELVGQVACRCRCSLATLDVASACLADRRRSCSSTQCRSRGRRARSRRRTPARAACCRPTTVQRDAARQVEHLDAAVVGGDQRALGGRQRDEELALRVLAVDLERAGEADRHLRDAGEVLDVALGDRAGRTNSCRCARAWRRCTPRRTSARSRMIAGEALSSLSEGTAGALDALLGDRVLDLEREGAEGLRIKGQRDLVRALLSGRCGRGCGLRGRGEGDGAGRRHRGGGEVVAVDDPGSSRSSGTAGRRCGVRPAGSGWRCESRFLRLKRTPSSTFSRLPSVYICLR